MLLITTQMLAPLLHPYNAAYISVMKDQD